MKASEHTLRYIKEATCFNEALPLGNGRIGAMVYGGVSVEKISLNEDTFWSGYPKDKHLENYPEVYQQAMQLFEQGKVTEAQKLVETRFGGCLVQMYLPLLNLKICMLDSGQLTTNNYSRVLKLSDAIHTVSYVQGEKRYKRECFVSEPYQVMAIRFSCSDYDSINFNVCVDSPFFGQYEMRIQKNLMQISGEAPNCVAEYGDRYTDTTHQVFEGKGVHYACTVGVKHIGGTVKYTGKSLNVRGADEVILYVAVRTNFESYNMLSANKTYKEKSIADIKCAMKIPYNTLKKNTIHSHRKLYNNCQISLSEGIKTRVPTDVRLQRLAKGISDNGIYALLFNYGKYLTISGSRCGTQLMNLQGIWNDNILPPWNSNYTLNINTEMNYWPTLPMGLFTCYEPFVRFVTELAEEGQKTAKEYYGKEGWVCHHSSDLWRLTHPGTNRLPNNAHWGFWNMASGWLSIMLWNYYRYTLDSKYLVQIYPILEGAARFYKELLVEWKGYFVLPLSTSPENKYIDEIGAHAIDQSTAMTQEILYDLFRIVSKAAQILHVKDNYGDLVTKLKRPFVQKNGELCEWHTEHEIWDMHHRHVSHLYGLFPSKQFEDDSKMKSACKKVLLARGDGGTGWSLAWKINLWARLGDGEHALRLLNNQLRLVSANENGQDMGGGTYPNMFCAHPPFQIDGNFGAANGIIEMLVQCDEQGKVQLLPALPQTWKTGSVKNLYLPDNRSISFAWKDGKVVWSKIKDFSVV